jgi:hypothetical protein
MNMRTRRKTMQPHYKETKTLVCSASGGNKEEFMKKVLTFMIMTLLIMAAGTALANDTYQLTVQATVVGTCRFTAPTSSTLTLPNITFDLAGNSTPSTGNTTISYWCTKGTAPTLTEQSTSTNFTGGSTGALPRTLVNGPDSINYTITLTDTGRALTDLPTTSTDINIQADVAAGAANNVTADVTYQDVVFIDVTP